MKYYYSVSRLKICHDWRSCKIFSSCANFFLENNAFFFAKFAQKYEILSFIWWVHTNFSPKLFRFYIFISISIKKRTNIIFIEICAILLLAKLVTIYAVLVCIIFCPKIRSCNFLRHFMSACILQHCNTVYVDSTLAPLFCNYCISKKLINIEEFIMVQIGFDIFVVILIILM